MAALTETGWICVHVYVIRIYDYVFFRFQLYILMHEAHLDLFGPAGLRLKSSSKYRSSVYRFAGVSFRLDV